MWALVRFNATVASRRRKMRQVFTPIIMNVIIIALLRASTPDRNLPNTKLFTDMDAFGYCVPTRETTVSFYCDGEVITAEFCDSAFETFHSSLNGAGLEVSRYMDNLAYKNSLRESEFGLGAYLSSPTRLELDVPPILYPVLTAREVSDGSTCRSFGDSQCGPIVFVSSCAAAVEISAMNALKTVSGSTTGEVSQSLNATSFMVFPQHAAVMDGIVNSYLIWLIPLYLSGLFLNLFNFALIELVIEKEGNHMEYLMGWGISRLDHFWAWLLGNVKTGLSACFIITVSLFCGNVYSFHYLLPVFFSCGSYLSSLLMLAYAMSVHLNSARSASSLASFTDLVFNLAALSSAAVNNRLYSMLVAVIPTVPFFLVIRGLAYDQANVWNPSYSTNFCLFVSILISIGSFFAVSTLLNSKSTPHNVFSAPTAGISVSGLCKSFDKKPVLRNVSLRVASGEIHSLVGGNGAGKTTLIRSLLRIIFLDYADEFSVPPSSSIACCLQQDAVWESLTVGDHVDFFAMQLGACKKSRIDFHLEKLQLNHLINQQCSTLSGGQKRRLSFLLALAKAEHPETSLVILDEPTTGVDVEGRIVFWDCIKTIAHDQNKAVLLTTHYLDEAQELSDKVTFLVDGGEVKASGSVVELRNSIFGGGFVLTISLRTEEEYDELKRLIPRAWELRKFDSSNQNFFSFKVSPEDAMKYVKVLEEKSSIDFTLESVSLHDLFTDLVPPIQENQAEEGPAFVSANISRSGQILAISRIRVVPIFTNFKSFFSNIVFPILLIGFSLFSRNLNLFQSSQPPLSVSDSFSTGELKLESSVFDPIHGNYFQVPLLGDWNRLPFPSEFELMPLPGDTTMMDFLWESSPQDWFPFAIDANTVWLNPTSPAASFAILAYMHDPSVTVTVKSYVSDIAYFQESIRSVLTILLYTVLSLAAVSTQSSSQLFDEKSNSIKRLSLVQGLTPLAYWTGSCLGHFLVHAVVVFSAPIVLVITLGSVITEVPSSFSILTVSAIVTTVQLILFGYMYLSVFSDKQSMLKYSSLFSALLFENITLFGAFNLLVLRSSPGLLDFFCAMIVPPYTLAAVIAELVSIYFRNCSLVENSCHFDGSNSPWCSGVMYPIVGGVFQVMILASFLVLRESRCNSYSKFNKCVWAIDDRSDQTPVKDCVKIEQQRILDNCSDDVLFVKLWHAFPPALPRIPLIQSNNQHPSLPPLVQWVVRDVSLGVRKNEILGLLGKNGAGKTTALSILIGAFRQIAGYSGIWPGKRVGFCPQSNALWEKLSAVEHVRFYSCVRGCWQNESQALALLASVGINEADAWKPTSLFSGGMKRRLCICIAFIGEPDVLILDEPTAGVDVSGKREVWAIIKNRLKILNCSVIITTHSLEEANSLCTRISVMDSGRLVRIGTTTDLKRSQNTLIVGFVASDPVGIDLVIQQRLNVPDTHVKFVQHNKIQVSMETCSLYDLLELLFRLKEEGRIELFTLQHLSLQDIFIRIVGND